MMPIVVKRQTVEERLAELERRVEELEKDK